MTKVYIANCTPQNHTANFRGPESRKPLSLAIGSGRQVLAGDLSTPEVDAMVDQLGRYGLVHVDEAGKSGRKVTFLYSTGTPLPASAILRVAERNKGILRDEGAERRKLSAVAANAVMNSDETPIDKLETSIEEVSSGDFGGDSENIAEGIKIDNKADTNENKPKRKKKQRVE
jgi:hypothetical protein